MTETMLGGVRENLKAPAEFLLHLRELEGKLDESERALKEVEEGAAELIFSTHECFPKFGHTLGLALQDLTYYLREEGNGDAFSFEIARDSLTQIIALAGLAAKEGGEEGGDDA